MKDGTTLATTGLPIGKMHLTAERPGTTVVQFAEWCEDIIGKAGADLVAPTFAWGDPGAPILFTFNKLDFELGVKRCTAQGIVNAYWLACHAEPRAKASAPKDA